MDPYAGVPIWRRVVSSILDGLTAFFVFGYLVARFSGGLTEDGFSLEGGPALLLFALVIAYFVIGRRFLGGTPWQHILGARRSARPQA
ncbi:MAG TPA: hypothetical protein VE650_03545 [Acetobacteraceae bacterium]|nr:hypothetical protein [Acetobacteraceae bacterium]